MPKVTHLDRQWAHLMSLCENEAKFLAEDRHPRLLRLVQAEIEDLAREMGFSDAAIATRDFRAERDGSRIVRIIAG
jgi:AraC-like DNA-binding protein